MRIGQKTGFPLILLNMLDNYRGESVVKIGENNGRFKIEIVGISPHRFTCHTNRFFTKKIGRLPPISISVVVGGSIEKSFGVN